MEITRGKIQKAKKVVIYGPEGIGKSTFAARFPGAVFIDTEGSTNDMDVARLPRPTSWNMLFDEIEYIKTHTDECRTLVIDTIDWAELLCVEHICAVHNKKGIEDFGLRSMLDMHQETMLLQERLLMEKQVLRQFAQARLQLRMRRLKQRLATCLFRQH